MTREEEFARHTLVTFIHKCLYEKFDRSFKKQEIRDVVRRKFAKERKIAPDDPVAIYVMWATDRFLSSVLKHETDGIQDYQCFVDGLRGEVWRLTDAMTLRQWEASLASARKNARRVSAAVKKKERNVALFRTLVNGSTDVKFGAVRSQFLAEREDDAVDWRDAA